MVGGEVADGRSVTRLLTAGETSQGSSPGPRRLSTLRSPTPSSVAKGLPRDYGGIGFLRFA